MIGHREEVSLNLITGGRRISTFSPLFKRKLIPMTENGFVKIIEREKEVHLTIY
jgi:hypothetical protein